MAAVLGQFPQHVQVNPAQRQRAPPVTLDQIVEPQGGCSEPGRLAGFAVCLLDGGDGVAVVEDKRPVRRRRNTNLGACPAWNREEFAWTLW